MLFVSILESALLCHHKGTELLMLDLEVIQVSLNVYRQSREKEKYTSSTVEEYFIYWVSILSEMIQLQLVTLCLTGALSLLMTGWPKHPGHGTALQTQKTSCRQVIHFFSFSAAPDDAWGVKTAQPIRWSGVKGHFVFLVQTWTWAGDLL